MVNCLCSDGVRRKVVRVLKVENAFNFKGYVQVKRRLVFGHAVYRQDGWEFVVDKTGKNGHLLP